MHQGLDLSRHETVIDEKIFMNVKFFVVVFEVSGSIIFHAVTQDQILSACWRTDRVGLHKSHLMQGALQRGWRE
jgi:hypothetical protein